MVNSKFIVNFHEHPRNTALEDNRQWGVDFTVFLTVGRKDSLKGRQIAYNNPDKCVSFHWVEVENDINHEIHRLKMAVNK